MCCFNLFSLFVVKKMLSYNHIEHVYLNTCSCIILYTKKHFRSHIYIQTFNF